MAAARVSVAVLVPDLLVVAVNVVVPHPLRVTPPTLTILNVGSSRLMLSLLATSGVFNANMNEIAVGPSVTGFAMIKYV